MKNNNKDEVKKNPTTEEVRMYLKKLIQESFSNGEKEITIISGVVHDDLNMHEARPVVCSAMRSLGPEYKYKVVYSPPKGNGSTLEHVYYK